MINKLTLFTLSVDKKGQPSIVMDEVFSGLDCEKEATKIMNSYKEMFYGVSDSLIRVLIKAQEET